MQISVLINILFLRAFIANSSEIGINLDTSLELNNENSPCSRSSENVVANENQFASNSYDQSATKKHNEPHIYLADVCKAISYSYSIYKRLEASFYPYFYYSSSTKCITMNAKGFNSHVDYFYSVHYSFYCCKTRTFEVKNAFVNSAMLQMAVNLLCYNEGEMLIFDNCVFDSVFKLNTGYYLKHLQTIEVLSCDLNQNLIKFLNFFKYSFALPDENDCPENSSKKNQSVSKKCKLEIVECFLKKDSLIKILENYNDILECVILKDCFFTLDFITKETLNLRNLRVVRIIHCSLYETILARLLKIFPSKLEILELSYLCVNDVREDYISFGWSINLDFANLQITQHFPNIKILIVKENRITNFSIKDFKKLEVIETVDFVCNGIDLHLSLASLLELNVTNFNDPTKLFTFLQLFKEKELVIDCRHPITICKEELITSASFAYIKLDLSLYEDAVFASFIDSMKQHAEKTVKSIKFENFPYPAMILRMNHVLRLLPHISSISIKVNRINYSEESVIREFKAMGQFHNVENLAIEYVGSKSFLSATQEFIFQTLTKFPKLKRLQIITNGFSVVDEYFTNELKIEKLHFPGLQNIEIIFENYIFSINHVILLLQQNDICKLSLQALNGFCYDDKLFGTFSNNSVKSLSIRITERNMIFYKEFIQKLIRLETLQLNYSCFCTCSIFEENSSIQSVIFCYDTRISIKDFDFNSFFSSLTKYSNLSKVYIKCLDDSQYMQITEAFKKSFAVGSVKLILFFQSFCVE